MKNFIHLAKLGLNFVSWVVIKVFKVASSSLSQLVAYPRIFRLFMKGKFDAYVL